MSDLQGWHVRGPVRVIRREHAEWDRGQHSWRAPHGLTVVTFRPDGQISESESHNPDGSIASCIRVFDAGGRVREVRWRTDEHPAGCLLLSYDAAGRPTGAVDVSPDGQRRETERSRYDERGRRIRLRFLDALRSDPGINDELEGTAHSLAAPGATTCTTTYDDRERPIEVEFSGADGTLILRVVFSRDGEGRLLTESVLFGGEMPFRASELENVSSDKRAALTALLPALFPEHTFSTTDYTYDLNGRLTGRTMRSGGVSAERTTFQYDDRGNPTDEISLCRGRSIDLADDGVAHASEEEPRYQHTRFEYTYDARDNWTQCIVSSRSDPDRAFQRTDVERRTITYFPG